VEAPLGGVWTPLAPELWHTYHSLKLAGWEAPTGSEEAPGSRPMSEEGDTRDGVEDSYPELGGGDLQCTFMCFRRELGCV